MNGWKEVEEGTLVLGLVGAADCGFSFDIDDVRDIVETYLNAMLRP